MGKSIQKKDFYMKNLIFLLFFSALHTIFFFLFTAQSIKEVANSVSAQPQIFALNGVVIFVGVLIFYGISGHVKFSVLANGLVIFLFALINRMQILKAHRPLHILDFLNGFSTVQHLFQSGHYPDLLGIFLLFFFLGITFILLHPLHFKRISLKGRAITLIVTLLSMSTLYLSLYRSESLWESFSLTSDSTPILQYNEKGALYSFVYTLDKDLSQLDRGPKQDSSAEVKKESKEEKGREVQEQGHKGEKTSQTNERENRKMEQQH